MGKHKESVFIYLLFLSVFFVIPSGFSLEKNVTTPDGQVSVVYPDGWERAVPSKGYSLLLGFVEPDTKIRANISLMITNIPGISKQKFTLDQLLASIKANLDKTLQSKYRNLTKSTMAVLGKEILALKYDIQQGNANITCKQYYIFAGDIRYLFTSVASQKNFAQYEAHFDHVVQSVKINH